MVPYFKDPIVAAVTPAIIVRTPTSILERIQYAEYNIGVFLRKMYSTFNAIHVTPGPFSMFRRSVFAIVGPFRSAYNTEDLEMALRLHRHNFKIENAEHARVFTTPPATIKKLIKQRVRWTTGFLLNLRDYKDLLFSKDHGQIGTFTLPAGIISLVTVLFFAGYSAVDAATTMTNHIIQYNLTGWHFHWNGLSLQWFFVDTTTVRLTHDHARRPRRYVHLLRQEDGQRLMEAVDGHVLLCLPVWIHRAGLGGDLVGTSVRGECGELEIIY